MKKFQVALAALAAVAGIGGAYASANNHAKSTAAADVYNWYTPAGRFTFAGTIHQATLLCTGGPKTCLRGTIPGKPQVTLFKL